MKLGVSRRRNLQTTCETERTDGLAQILQYYNFNRIGSLRCFSDPAAESIEFQERERRLHTSINKSQSKWMLFHFKQSVRFAREVCRN